jgi:glutamine amidotransferase
MANPQIALLDYGINNLKSVRKAFNHVGRSVEVVTNGADLQRPDAMVLPGIGAFGKAMEELRDRQLIEPIQDHVEAGRPMLGICLGMQLLLTRSSEFGHHKGLDLIPGTVARFESAASVSIPHYKVPHMGWNEIYPPEGKPDDYWEGTLLERSEPNANCYFVHSFYADPDDPGDVLAVGQYFGQTFTAVVRSGAVVGTQFHPEKSGQVGLEILETFCEISGL